MALSDLKRFSMPKQQARPIAPDKLVTVDQVAEWLHCCNATVYRRIKDGTLPAIKVGKGYLIPYVELCEVLGSMELSKGFNQRT